MTCSDDKRYSLAVFFSGNPHALNGAAKYFQRMATHKERFDDQGVSMEVYHGAIDFTNQKLYQESTKGRIKKHIKKLLSNTSLGTKIVLRYAFLKHAEEAVTAYLLDGKRFDAALFHDIWSLSVFARRAPEFPGAIICVHHGDGDLSKMLKEAYPYADEKRIAKLEKEVVDVSDCIVFVGERNKQRFLSLHSEACDKAVHIYTGIDDIDLLDRHNEVKPDDERLKFVVVGTVSTRKNQRTLIELLDRNLLKEPVEFIVVGDGPDLDYCMRRVGDSGLEDFFVFAGSTNDVCSYMLKADAFVSVSRDEGLPIAALEAMSLRLPLLLTDVGGCSELIDGNGVLATGCDVDPLADAFNMFIDLYRDKRISGECSRALYEEHYTTERMCDEYAGLVKRLCETKHDKK